MIQLNGKLSCYLLRLPLGPVSLLKLTLHGIYKRSLSPGGKVPLTGQVTGQIGNNFIIVYFEENVSEGALKLQEDRFIPL